MSERIPPSDFVSLLRAAAQVRDDELRTQFRRSLPFADAMFDRWERARSLGFGEGASIYDSACVFGDVRVGKNVWIGPWVMLDGSGGGLEIGDWTSISAGVQLYTHDTVLRSLSAGKSPIRQGSVTIADRVYIGSQSIITLGVRVGRMSVISANSLVLDDVPERAIVGGAPARKIGTVIGDDDGVYLQFNHHNQG